MSFEKIDFKKKPTISDNNSGINLGLYKTIWLNFYFYDDTKLLWEFDDFNEYLEKVWFVKIFDTEHMLINKNWNIDKKLLSKLNSLAVQNKNTSSYNYVTNIYFPWDGVYIFYFKHKFNGKKDDRIYYDINEYLTKIKQFLKIRKNEGYFVSIFVSNPWTWKWPSLFGLEAINNKDYNWNIKKVA